MDVTNAMNALVSATKPEIGNLVAAKLASSEVDRRVDLLFQATVSVKVWEKQLTSEELSSIDKKRITKNIDDITMLVECCYTDYNDERFDELHRGLVNRGRLVN